MTENRYITILLTGDIQDTVTNEFLRGNGIARRLNELQEENQDNKAMIEFLDTENTQIMNELKTRTQIQHQLEEENEQLKNEMGDLGTAHAEEINKIEDEFFEEILKLEKENEELKEEIAKFKEWEKHIGDVKREDLDRVFKMSLYEIAEAFRYYRKRIKELEG